MSRFASAVARMDRALARKLSDSVADYYKPDGQRVAQGIDVMVTRNLQKVGADGGVFLTNQVGITWLKQGLAAAERGGEFRVGGERFLVEEEVSDDGAWVTVACMVKT